MSKKLLMILLAASLLFNVAAVAGMAYVRYVSVPRLDFEAVSASLDLDAAGRQQLRQMRRGVWANLRESRQENLQAVRQINAAVADKPAGDPAFAAALDGLSAARRARQEKMLVPVLQFRDSLTPASRERFVAMSKDPQFMLELFGLRLDADAR
jgi:uncharacterized membrane protein